MSINIVRDKMQRSILLIYNICLLCVAISPVFTYVNLNKLSRYIFFMFMLVSSIVLLELLKIKKTINSTVASQYFVIFFLWALFFLAALSNHYTRESYKVGYLLFMEIAFTILGLFFWGTCLSWKESLKKFCSYFKENYILFIFAFSLFFFSFEVLHSWTNWDSKEYYRVISNLKTINFSPNDIAMFKSAGHMSYGYMFIMAIGEFFFPTYGVGARLVNVLLLVGCIFFFESILKQLMPNSNKKLNYAATFLFFITPTIWGPLYEQNVEISVVSFFIFFLWAFLRQYNIMTAFWGTMLVFTKETSVILVGGFAIGYIISLLVKNKNIKILFKKDVFKQMLALYIPCVLFLLYFVLDGSGWANNVTFESQKQINLFAINITYIIAKLKQMFIVNFQWIITVSIIVFCLFIFLKKRNKTTNYELTDYYMVIPLLTTYVLFLIIQLFYVTYLLPRYICINYFFMALMFAYVLNIVNINIIIKYLQCVIIGILLILQTFITCDPLTFYCFSPTPIGEGYVASANILLTYDDYHIVTGKGASVMALSPYTAYNRQYLYKYRLMENILSSINYSTKDVIVLPDLFHPISNGTYWGYVTENYYDSITKKVYQLYEPKTTEMNNKDLINYVIQNESDTKINLENYEHAYFIDFPYNEKFDSDSIISLYNASLEKEINYRGWSAKIYQIK